MKVILLFVGLMVLSICSFSQGPHRPIHRRHHVVRHHHRVVHHHVVHHPVHRRPPHHP
jgi:hypothetical protein